MLPDRKDGNRSGAEEIRIYFGRSGFIEAVWPGQQIELKDDRTGTGLERLSNSATWRPECHVRSALRSPLRIAAASCRILPE